MKGSGSEPNAASHEPTPSARGRGSGLKEAPRCTVHATKGPQNNNNKGATLQAGNAVFPPPFFFYPPIPKPARPSAGDSITVLILIPAMIDAGKTKGRRFRVVLFRSRRARNAGARVSGGGCNCRFAAAGKTPMGSARTSTRKHLETTPSPSDSLHFAVVEYLKRPARMTVLPVFV